MKFCYFDESGMGEEPILIMASVIVDAQRMHQTKVVWADFMDSLSNAIGKKVNEFHACQFYRGSGSWGKIDGPERTKIISAIRNWIEKRKHHITSHHITYSAVDKEAYNEQKNKFNGIPTAWSAAVFHIALVFKNITSIRGIIVV